MQYLRSTTGRYEYENEDMISEEESSEEVCVFQLIVMEWSHWIILQKEDEEPWNPLEIIDQLKKEEDKAEKLKLKRHLMEKLLDQKSPIITTKMKEFFLEEGDPYSNGINEWTQSIDKDIQVFWRLLSLLWLDWMKIYPPAMLTKPQKWITTVVSVSILWDNWLLMKQNPSSNVHSEWWDYLSILQENLIH